MSSDEAASLGPAPWPRPSWEPGGGAADVVLFVFCEQPLDPALEVNAARHGLPGGGLPDGLELRAYPRERHAEWIDGFFKGSVGAFAKQRIGWDEPPLERVQHAAVIRATAEDPSDLRYLQAAWAVARAVCEGCGGLCVLDAHAIAWYGPDSLPDPAAPPALDQQVRLLFETEPAHGYGHVAHTRGLRKFGRPDVVLTRLNADDGARAGNLLGAVARALVDGVTLAPGDRFQGPEMDLMAMRYVPGLTAPALELNNDGLLLQTWSEESERAHRSIEALIAAAAADAGDAN